MNIQQRAATVLQEIDAALALAEKATLGPWTHHKTGYAIHGFDNGFICKTEYGDADASKRRQENAAFIAASRTGWPTALRCLKTAIEGLLEMQAANRDNFGGNRDAGIAQVFRARLTALCNQWEASRK